MPTAGRASCTNRPPRPPRFLIRAKELSHRPPRFLILPKKSGFFSSPPAAAAPPVFSPYLVFILIDARAGQIVFMQEEACELSKAKYGRDEWWLLLDPIEGASL